MEATKEKTKKVKSIKESEPKAEVTKTTKKVKAIKSKGLEPVKEKASKAIKEEVKVNLIESVISKREVKYIYPEDCQDTLSRKKYRQQVRNKLHQLELAMRRIEDKQSKEFKAKEKEYLEYKKGKVKEGVAA